MRNDDKVRASDDMRSPEAQLTTQAWRYRSLFQHRRALPEQMRRHSESSSRAPRQEVPVVKTKPRSNIPQIDRASRLVTEGGRLNIRCDEPGSFTPNVVHSAVVGIGRLALTGQAVQLIVEGSVIAEATTSPEMEGLRDCLRRGHTFDARLRRNGDGWSVDYWR